MTCDSKINLYKNTLNLFVNLLNYSTGTPMKLLNNKIYHLLCIVGTNGNVRYDVRIKTMFGSSLPPVVCRRAHVLFTISAFVYV